MDQNRTGTASRRAVEDSLIAAFRVLPSRAVFSRGSRLVAPSGDLVALTWACHLDHDPEARTILWAWARCRATGESFGALCREIGWRRPTAETARRRASAAIAAALARNHSQPLATTRNHRST